MQPDGAITVLLLIGGVSAVIAAVPPPENLNVSCQNLKTTVRWDYSEDQPQTSFTVALEGSGGRHFEMITTDHQYDLSHLIWGPGQQYMEFHYVTVTATQGANRSEAVTSKSFSFNDLKSVSLKCELDFPPVNLTVGDSRVTVRFQNPLHVYKELKEAVKYNSAYVKFFFFLGGSKTRIPEKPQDLPTCSLRQDICIHDVQLPEDREKCVKLKGWLCDNECFSWVVFKEREICTSNSTVPGPEIQVMTLGLLLGIFVLAIIVVSIFICKVKAWTMKIPVLPDSLVLKDPDLLNLKQHLKYNPVPNPLISPITVTPLDPHRTYSVDSEEDCPTQHPQGSSASSDPYPGAFYMERGLSGASNQELEAQEFSGRCRTDDSSVDSMKTESVSMEEEEAEEERAPYEPRAQQADMGDGDMVDCYSGS